jgi:hypothetical protein
VEETLTRKNLSPGGIEVSLQRYHVAGRHLVELKLIHLISLEQASANPKKELNVIQISSIYDSEICIL